MNAVVGRLEDDVVVRALLAAFATLPAAVKERLLRRLVDSLHVERELDETLLDPETQRDQKLTRALRLVADELGRAPSTPEYAAAYKRARADGDTSLPSVSTIVKRYRTWKRALFAAGLAGSPPSDLIQQRRLLRTRPARYPRERLIGCLGACAADLGRVPSVRDYDAWREQKRREAVASGRARPDVPFSRTIRERFGGWAPSLAAAGLAGGLEDRFPAEWWSPISGGVQTGERRL